MICFFMNRKTGKTLLALMVGCIFLGLASLQAIAIAAEDGITDTSAMIQPIPETKYEGVHDFRQDGEKYYDFIGTVDDVQKEGIVVGDSYMKFANTAKISGVRAGTEVGIVLNDAGEVVLCEPFKQPVGE